MFQWKNWKIKEISQKAEQKHPMVDVNIHAYIQIDSLWACIQ